jgi:hypothetical protein
MKNIDGFADQQTCPLYPKVADIFGMARTFTVVLRPDNYIGFLASGHYEDEIREYFGNIFGRTLTE